MHPNRHEKRAKWLRNFHKWYYLAVWTQAIVEFKLNWCIGRRKGVPSIFALLHTTVCDDKCAFWSGSRGSALYFLWYLPSLFLIFINNEIKAQLVKKEHYYLHLPPPHLAAAIITTPAIPQGPLCDYLVKSLPAFYYHLATGRRLDPIFVPSVPRALSLSLFDPWFLFRVSALVNRVGTLAIASRLAPFSRSICFI